MKSKIFLMLSGVVSAFVLALAPELAFAGGEPAGFSWLVGIPGVQGGGFNQYINALYALAISLAALIAVLKIVIAGAKYMMDDIVTHKSEAKKDIYNALIGLLIVIGAVIILNTINTDLTNVQVDATPATVDDDPIEFVDLASYIEDATNANTPVVRAYCTSWLDQRACREACRTVYQGQMVYDVGYLGNFCQYRQDLADQCDPQQSADCCITVKGGDWDEDATSNRCSGMISDEERADACYSEKEGKGTWDDINKTCRTTDCNRRTDQRCCEIGYGGTYVNGDCSIDTYNEEQDAENGTQDYQASQCVTVDGGLWNYTTGQCDDRDNQYGYDVIPNTQFVDPNYNPQERCDSLEEQMGITVEYVASIRSCRWSN